MPAPRNSDQVIADFAAQMARRYAAANLLQTTGDTAGDWRWTISSRHGEVERSGGPGLPEPIEDCFACVSLSDPAAPGAVDDVHRLLANACGGILFSSLDTLTDPAHIRERVAAYEQVLNAHGLFPDFVGARLGAPAEPRLLAVFSEPSRHIHPPPANFRVLALITAFNEEDVITQVIAHLAQQGVDVV